ncbi:MAG: BREX-1 system phosphatase PglZ type B [Planctomycetes bacterium]|nr:BREX-1 system phosphatase PglZ type B [Planctomycetota bacterium]
MRVLDQLIQSIRGAATHNPDVQAAPACILWPDEDRQWAAVVPRLQAEMPELFQLGEYRPEQRIGPAIWLRCVLAGLVPEAPIPPGATPIFYLPGVGRSGLRAVESCPEPLKPLAELQYRGVIWSQVNAKDWTVLAFLKSNQGGLALDVSQDADSKHAMQLALYRVLDEELDLLRGKRLDKDYFNTLLSGGDPVRDLLQWLDQGDAFQAARDKNAWQGFVEVCKSQLGFDPVNEGPIHGAGLLAAHQGPWQALWERYREAPRRYPRIPQLLRKTSPPRDLLSDKSGWPQWNEGEEASLRDILLAASQQPHHAARKSILEAEAKHGARRECVWAELGEAPLAMALEHLAAAAQVTGQSLAAGSPQDMAAAYRNGGWKADAAVVAALAAVQKLDDCKAVQAIVETIYLPWVDEAARHLQAQVEAGGYPGKTIQSDSEPEKKPGECWVFVDGLRLDLARRLEALLQEQGFAVEGDDAWAALPSITATAKPAVSPIRRLVRGKDVNADFEPAVAATGQSLKGGYHFKKLLKDNAWQLLDRSDTGDPSGSAWTEVGNLDHEGHERGAQLARHLDVILADIRDRIVELLSAGWETIRIVTDHGWLLAPGGLPKADLPSVLTQNTWGRCAAIKPGAKCQETLYPWYWNPDLHFALAPGARCYRAGVEYTHGGLSLQECVVMYLVAAASAAGRGASVKIQKVSWKGMRCKVTIEGEPGALRLDIRTHAGNALTSVTTGSRPFKADGTASVVVEDDHLAGHNAAIVVLDDQGRLVAQRNTVIAKDDA